MEVPWVVIGEISGPQGRRGEIRVYPHTEFPERFHAMNSVRIFQRDKETLVGCYGVESSRNHRKGIVLKLEGVDDIQAAEQLQGLLIQVRPSELKPLPEGRHYIFELIGLDVVTTEGDHLGTIEDVLQTGANDVYLVTPLDRKRTEPILIPVIEDVVLDVNVSKGHVLIQLMKGLLD